MSMGKPKYPEIDWYRTPVDREVMKALNQRSNLLGLCQALGHIGLLTLTGATAWYAAGHWPFPVLLLIIFIHGTFFKFLDNGFHELVHSTVFRTKSINGFFLRIYSFLCGLNHVHFWASHQEHHRYTLHPPADLEVVLPTHHSLARFLKSSFIDPVQFLINWKVMIRHSCGRLEGEWEHTIFPESAPEKIRKLQNWARTMVAGHLAILGVSIWFGWWLLPVLTTLGPFYGGWLFFFCNNTQHAGLTDNVTDFRLCCRTVILSPFVRFLYWHMNYHTEHHMYAAVPCYKLGKLHALIKDDLQSCPQGLVKTWRQIIAIQKRQKTDPEYQFTPELPEPKAE